MLLCATRWKGLSDEEKAPYQHQAQRSKEDTAERRAETRQADKEKRGPLSAYNVFVREVLPTLRASQPGLTSSEYFKLASEQWKTMAVDEKLERQNAYAQVKEAWGNSRK